ncbi:hypothetical protein B0H16DRAFT_1687371 [Mycena metata]|uniref:Uncharacterized protein n=1 Tax=Mycena metata TaxID=1033252 RepID=A0AAD7JKE7_9AGAR|nr:hypothetical protein B0H16DRAFT_1687371 [Mycena metata]
MASKEGEVSPRSGGRSVDVKVVLHPCFIRVQGEFTPGPKIAVDTGSVPNLVFSTRYLASCTPGLGRCDGVMTLKNDRRAESEDDTWPRFEEYLDSFAPAKMHLLSPHTAMRYVGRTRAGLWKLLGYRSPAIRPMPKKPGSFEIPITRHEFARPVLSMHARRKERGVGVIFAYDADAMSVLGPVAP